MTIYIGDHFNLQCKVEPKYQLFVLGWMKYRVCFSVNKLVHASWRWICLDDEFSCGLLWHKKRPLTDTEERKYPNTHVCGVWPPAWVCGLQRLGCNGGGLCVNASMDVSGVGFPRFQPKPGLSVYTPCLPSIHFLFGNNSWQRKPKRPQVPVY